MFLVKPKSLVKMKPATVWRITLQLCLNHGKLPLNQDFCLKVSGPSQIQVAKVCTAPHWFRWHLSTYRTNPQYQFWWSSSLIISNDCIIWSVIFKHQLCRSWTVQPVLQMRHLRNRNQMDLFFCLTLIICKQRTLHNLKVHTPFVLREVSPTDYYIPS